MALISYKMTNDSGFAPNPFHGYLTLATCKPGIRRSSNRQVGDWIAGFTSMSLCGDPVGGERLVYLMRVDEILTLGAYFADPRFKAKVPVRGSANPIERAGDNIYRPLVDSPRDAGDYEQVPNDNHPPHSKAHDVSGRNVLVAHAGNYFYFGRNALDAPADVRPEIPVGQSGYGKGTIDPRRVTSFIAYVKDSFDPTLEEFPAGLNGWPHDRWGGIGYFNPAEPTNLLRAYASDHQPRRRIGCAR